MTDDEIERFAEHIAMAIARNPRLMGDLLARVDVLLARARPADDAVAHTAGPGDHGPVCVTACPGE